MVIPDYLIYEVMDGKPIYYRGYKEVLIGKKQSAEIRGYNERQFYLLNFVATYLQSKIKKSFRILYGGGGLQANNDCNFYIDLSIFYKSDLSISKIKDKNCYLTIVPKTIIQIDTKADNDIFTHFDYFNIKIQRLLEFGVEKVVWVFTETEQVIVAVANQPWIIVNWKDEIEILGCVFSIQQVIDEAEQEI